MESVIEERISSLEQALGVTDRTDAKSTDFDIYAIRKTLEKKGLNHILKAPKDELKRLRLFLEQPASKPLSEKLSIFQCGEEITRKRVALLEDFENRLKIVLDCTHLTNLEEHDQKLEEAKKEVQDSLISWKEHSQEVEEFIQEYSCIMQGLQEKLNDLEKKVALKESKK